MKWRLEVDPLNDAAFAILLAAATGAELLVWPHRNQPVVYTIPLLFAALRLRPRDVAVGVVLAIGIDLADAYRAQSPPDVWPFTLSALIGTGALAVLVASQRAESLRLAREAETARGQLQQFLGMVSHDRRGPLFAVLAHAQMVLTDHPERLPPEDHRSLERIESSAQQLRRLVDDLLDAARVGAGQFVVQPSRTDLVALTKQVVARRCEIDAGAVVQVDGPPSVIGTWDADRLRQVLENLLDNARKYSPEGRVWDKLRQDPQRAVVIVSDEGPGLAPEQVARLFKPFGRADPSGRARGTGLGLYIAKAIVEAHGGRVWVESTPGQGSAFSLTLPLRDSAN
jgi:signal transduction histidine kinase